MADAFKAGFPRTFIYQLKSEVANPSDSDPAEWLRAVQLRRHAKAGCNRHTQTYLILADPSSTAQTFSPGSLAYSISGLPSTAASLLLEKSDGTYDLTIWNDAQDWNAATASEAAASPTTVTVNLGGSSTSAAVFDPLSGTLPVATYANIQARCNLL